MAIRDLFTSRLAGPAGRVLDAPIRDIVHEILREHGYASPAEVQALRDELRDLRTRVDKVDRKLAELTLLAEEARAEAAAAKADAVSGLSLHATRAAPTADPRVAALEARVTALDAALVEARAEAQAAVAAAARLPAPAPAPAPAAPAAPAPVAAAPPLSAEPRAACKVGGCGEPVRSKGFCSPHYQQWRRGTLKGCVNADGTALVDGRVVQFPTDAVGGAVSTHDGKFYVDGKLTKEVTAS